MLNSLLKISLCVGNMDQLRWEIWILQTADAAHITWHANTHPARFLWVSYFPLRTLVSIHFSFWYSWFLFCIALKIWVILKLCPIRHSFVQYKCAYIGLNNNVHCITLVAILKCIIYVFQRKKKIPSLLLILNHFGRLMGQGFKIRLDIWIKNAM